MNITNYNEHGIPQVSVEGTYNKLCTDCHKQESTVRRNCGHGVCNSQYDSIATGTSFNDCLSAGCEKRPVCAGCQDLS